MKKIWLAVALMSSFPAFANQYFKIDLDCRARVDTRSLDAIKPEIFPPVSFGISAIVEHGSSKIYRTEVSGLDSIGTPRLTRSYREDYSSTYGWRTVNSITVKFPKIKKSQATKLLQELGLSNPRSLRALAFDEFRISYRAPDALDGVMTQIDFKDGEAYHVGVMCYFKDDSLNDLGITTWRDVWSRTWREFSEEEFDFKNLKIRRN